MLAAVRVVWAPCLASSTCAVISLKLASTWLRHSTMAFRGMEGMALAAPT